MPWRIHPRRDRPARRTSSSAAAWSSGWARSRERRPEHHHVVGRIGERPSRYTSASRARSGPAAVEHGLLRRSAGSRRRRSLRPAVLAAEPGVHAGRRTARGAWRRSAPSARRRRAWWRISIAAARIAASTRCQRRPRWSALLTPAPSRNNVKHRTMFATDTYHTASTSRGPRMSTNVYLEGNYAPVTEEVTAVRPAGDR